MKKLLACLLLALPMVSFAASHNEEIISKPRINVLKNALFYDGKGAIFSFCKTEAYPQVCYDVERSHKGNNVVVHITIDNKTYYIHCDGCQDFPCRNSMASATKRLESLIKYDFPDIEVGDEY